MITRKSISQMFSVLFVVVFMLAQVGSTHAAPALFAGSAKAAESPSLLQSTLSGQEVSFALDANNPSYAPAIDPSLAWNTFLGGNGDDRNESIVLDGSGNAYVTGRSDATWGSPVRAYTGGQDVFVAKVSSSGVLLWNTFLGGTGDIERGYSIAIDGSGNIFIAGQSNATWGSPVRPYIGDSDAFVAKLNSSGALTWNTFLGGSSYDGGYGIAVDGSGNVFVGGQSDATWGSPVRAHTGVQDGFAAKLDSSGVLTWNTFLGGNGNDSGGFGLTLDADGNIYFTGESDATWGSPVRAYTSGFDGYTAKLNSSGALTWNTFLGGSGTDYGNNMTVDSAGNVYMVGNSDATWGSPIRAYISDFDAYATKLNSSGALTWNTFLGGSGVDQNRDIAIDATGNIYVVGGSDATWGSPLRAYTGGNDGFVVNLSSSGALAWSTFLGASGADFGRSIDVNGIGDVYVAGQSDATWGSPVRAYTSGNDAFVTKLQPTFADVPFDHPLYKYIQALYDAGFTAGCSTSPLRFCPDTILDRAQSAVFMLRGQLGSGYTPPPAPWTNFVNESWVGFEWSQGWAEGMYIEGLTTGCQASPLKFCPANQLPRVEASIFGLKMKYGVNYTPPAATGTLFADFPSTDPSYWGIAWAEKAYVDGLLPACGTDTVSGKPMFCPGELVNRGWGAYLIVKAKGLPTQ